MSKSPLLMKRRMAAWLLLSVFVPMMVLLVVHQHDASAHSYTVCSDCAHHVDHPGHIYMINGHTHDCVLCQFTTIVFIGGTLLSVASLTPAARQLAAGRLSALVSRTEGLSLLRAPPLG